MEHLDQLLLILVTLTPLEALHHINTLMLVSLPAGQKHYGLKTDLYLCHVAKEKDRRVTGLEIA